MKTPVDPIEELQQLGEPVDEVALRRGRARLLEWAATEQRPARARVLVWSLSVAILAMGLVGVVLWRESAATLESSVTSVVADNAQWRTVSDDSVEHVDLSNGRLRLNVKRKPNSRRVIVRVPDGEIEDMGTVFDVVVRDGHTVKVGVDEGSVSMRLSGMAPVTIRAGQVWQREKAAEVVKPLPTVEKVAPVAPAPPARPVAVEPDHQHSPLKTPQPHAGVPDNTREDAAYLEIVRALRDGRADEGLALARQYLVDFPQGFRRSEIERVVKNSGE